MASTGSGRPVLLSTLVLIAIDVVGGLLAVSSGVNTWGEAWGPKALLAAPLPMMATQLALAWLAARNVRPPVGLVAAVLLGLACLVSVISGFFDGALASDELSGGLFAWQLFLLTATAVVGLLAILRARELRRKAGRAS
jgi:hypothetical protein